jgi:hypothetical protein
VKYGTAAGVGIPRQYDVAAKTGTAQSANVKNDTDDWMIAFAPATDPVDRCRRRRAVPTDVQLRRHRRRSRS